jgi:hypothetical protein
MFDRMTVQAEVDYRRERLTRSVSASTKRSRTDRTWIPFVGDQTGRRAR